MRRKTVRDESKTIPLWEWEMRQMPTLPWVFLGGILVLTLLIAALSFLGGGG